MDIKTVSAMLNHYDAGFTLRTYTHSIPVSDVPVRSLLCKNRDRLL